MSSNSADLVFAARGWLLSVRDAATPRTIPATRQPTTTRASRRVERRPVAGASPAPAARLRAAASA